MCSVNKWVSKHSKVTTE